MTELEEKLMAADADTQRLLLVQRIGAIMLRVERVMAQGAPRNEFCDLLTAKEALLAAHQVVNEWPHRNMLSPRFLAKGRTRV